MSDGEFANGPMVTPPAYVRRLEENVYAELREIRSAMHANQLALLHQVGQLARMMIELGATPPKKEES